MPAWTTDGARRVRGLLLAACALNVACMSSSSSGCGGAVDSGPVDGSSSDGPQTRDAPAGGADAPSDSPKDSAFGSDAPVDAGPTCAPDASFTSDPANCGSCGHDCFGGTCSNGKCAVFEIQYGGPGQKLPTGPLGCLEDGIVWADEGHWTSASGMVLNYTDGAIYGLPNTSTTPTSLTPFPMSGWGVATDGTNFFFVSGGTSSNNNWVGDGQILQCPVTGCSASPLVLAAGNVDGGQPLSPTALLSIGTAASAVYWSANAGISKTPVGGGASTLLASGSFTYFAATATDVYWAWSGQGIWREPIAGGSPTLLDGVTATITGLVVDAQNIYVMRNDGNAASYIASCPAPDCAGGLEVFQNNIGNPNASPYSAGTLGQDATSLFWTENDVTTTDLKTCTKASCSPSVVTSTQIAAGAMCVTDKAITWTSGVGIGRLAR